MELTKQDRKTLELFSWYAKGYGKENSEEENSKAEKVNASTTSE